METIGKILFLEDDPLIGALVSKGLQKAGFNVQWISRLENIHQEAEAHHPDIMVFDLQIGNRNCLEEIPRLRLSHPSVPILFASSHTDGKEIVACLGIGNAGYIKKPYELEELLYHIRRWLPARKNIISFGSYRLNPGSRELTYKNQPVAMLNPKEYDILYLLLSRRGEIVSRDELLGKVWYNPKAGGSLNNYITYLRKYFDKDRQVVIQTVRREGYMLVVYEKQG